MVLYIVGAFCTFSLFVFQYIAICHGLFTDNGCNLCMVVVSHARLIVHTHPPCAVVPLLTRACVRTHIYTHTHHVESVKVDMCRFCVRWDEVVVYLAQCYEQTHGVFVGTVTSARLVKVGDKPSCPSTV